MSEENENAPSPSSDERRIKNLMQVGKLVAESQMFGASNPAQGYIIADYCDLNDMALLEFQQKFNLIGGKPSRKPESMLADLIRDGETYEWIADGSDEKVATIKIGDHPPVSYTIEQALKAKLVKPDSGWDRNRPSMLRARVVSTAMRMYAPNLVEGIYTPEEIEDFQVDTPREARGEAVSPGFVPASDSATPISGEPKRRGRPPKSASQTTEAAATPDPAVPASVPASPVADQAPAVGTAGASGDVAPAASATTSPVAAKATQSPPSPVLNQVAIGLFAKAKSIIRPETWATVMERLGVQDAARRSIDVAEDQILSLPATAIETLVPWLEKQVAKIVTAPQTAADALNKIQ